MADFLMPEAIDDLVKATLRQLRRGSIVQIAQTYNQYHILNKWFKKNAEGGERTFYSDGYGIQQTIMNKKSGAARHKGLYDEDRVTVINLLSTFNISWCYVTTNWGYVVTEPMMNSGKSIINNVVKPRRLGAMLDMADEMESTAWSVPAPSDTQLPYGAPYWITSNTSQGFNGGAPTNHTTLAGLDLDNYPTFKNWTDTYSTISEDDLITKIRKAFWETDFESPVSGGVNDPTENPTMKDKCLYMKWDTRESLNKALLGRNDNIGRDLGYTVPGGGTPQFYGAPMYAVKYWEGQSEYSNNPIMGIDHNTFYPVIMSKNNMRETGPLTSYNNHDGREMHIDLQYNYICDNRRRNWRIDSA